MWHDLGKVRPSFQAYLRAVTAFEPAASALRRVDHSTAGAIHELDELGPAGRVIAYAIAGHHAGLADWHAGDSGGTSLSRRLRKHELLDDTLATGGVPPDLLRSPARTCGDVRPRGGSARSSCARTGACGSRADAFPVYCSQLGELRAEIPASRSDGKVIESSTRERSRVWVETSDLTTERTIRAVRSTRERSRVWVETYQFSDQYSGHWPASLKGAMVNIN
jgi:hypothetical protein